MRIPTPAALPRQARQDYSLSLRHNFNRHYTTNRAPLSLSFDWAWLQVNKGFTKVLVDWMVETLEEHNDVYFVTEIQVRVGVLRQD